MLRKLGFVIVLLLFGALMFLAGVLAPDGLRDRVAGTSRHWLERVGIGSSVAAVGVSEAGDAVSSAAGGADDSDDGEKARPYAELVLPTPLPPKRQYALQVEMVTDRVAAKPLKASLEAADHKPRLIDVTDPAGDEWVVVAAGAYDDPDAARGARPVLKRALGSPTRPLPVILLPKPEKKKGKDGQQAAGQGGDAPS